jgi:hypothetical protein
MEINDWVNNFIKVIVGVVGLMWVLLKYIISGHSKKLDKHFEDFNTFKEFQQEENSKNQRVGCQIKLIGQLTHLQIVFTP